MSSPTQRSQKAASDNPSRREGRTMERKTRARGAAVLFALGSLLAGLMVFAGPANAEDSGAAVADETSTASGGCVAVNGSVCSGSGFAANDSTRSEERRVGKGC